MKCDFCSIEGNWKNVIRSIDFQKKDSSDVIVCNDCLNLFANHKYNELVKKLEVE